MKMNWFKFYRDADPEKGGGGGGETPEAALLNKIKQTMKTEIETRGYADSAAIESILTTRLQGLSLDALRAYDTEKAKLELQVRNIAAALEKLKTNPAQTLQKVDNIRAFLSEKSKDIEKIFQARKKVSDGGQEIVFNVRAAAVMALGNTITEDAELPTDLIESMSMAEFVGKRYGVQYIWQIADRIVTSDLAEYTTWLEEGNEQGAFAIVAEGATKPLVSYDLVRNFVKYQKIAGKYIVTEEFTKFRKNAYAIIRRLIMDKLVRDYSALLTADLNAAAAAYTGTVLDGTVIAPNDYDAVGAVAAQIETLNFNADVLIIHPQDKWRIRLSKDDQGRYLFPVVTDGGVTKMLGFTLITSTYQTIGAFTLGESGLFKIEEEPITVRIGYGVTVTGANPVTAVVSDFDNNQVRVIVETFFKDWLATPNIGSFVRTTFATVKAALLAP